MNISHILVKHLHEAEDLLRLINEGKSFEALARQYSQCPSAPLGGWLGNLNGKKLDSNFENALQSLKPNEVSKPIKTQFGYHLIKTEE